MLLLANPRKKAIELIARIVPFAIWLVTLLYLYGHRQPWRDEVRALMLALSGNQFR